MTTKICPNYKIIKSLSSTLDRLEESGWHIRMMERHYHHANYFRWSLNSFLRSLKEVVQLLTMDIQGNSDVVKWFRKEREKLKDEPLVALLFKQRDIVVHQKMLKPASKGTVGFTRGRGLKLGLSIPIDPLRDSEEAILRYIYLAAKNRKDFLGILYTEEDGSGEYTCVQREWRMEQFPDTELTKLAAQAWERVAKLTLNTATKLGASVIEPKFELQNPNQVQFEIYRPEWIKEKLEHAKMKFEESTT